MLNPLLAVAPDGRLLARSKVAERLDSHMRVQRRGNGKAEMFLAEKFLTDKACGELVDQIRSNLRPSTIAGDDGDKLFRTSRTCDLKSDLPVVQAVRNAISQLMGIPLQFAEALQGQHYEPGQQFKGHTDYFDPGTPQFEEHCVRPGWGQRTWTAMAYLNDVEKGGHTLFPRLQVGFTPRRGDLLMWNNLMPGNLVNENTLHHATPVEAGEKVVITQWFRERPWG